MKLMERKTQPGAPPAVYGVVWSRFEPDRCASQKQQVFKSVHAWCLQQQQVFRYVFTLGA
jgi:hypothetical protein